MKKFFVFKPLQVTTTALSKAQNISSSLIYPVVNGLLKCHLKSDSRDLAAVKHFKEVVLVELQHHFPFDCENVAILAAAIDPRCQHLKFFTTEQREAVYTVHYDRVETS